MTACNLFRAILRRILDEKRGLLEIFKKRFVGEFREGIIKKGVTKGITVSMHRKLMRNCKSR